MDSSMELHVNTQAQASDRLYSIVVVERSKRQPLNASFITNLLVAILHDSNRSTMFS